MPVNATSERPMVQRSNQFFGTSLPQAVVRRAAKYLHRNCVDGTFVVQCFPSPSLFSNDASESSAEGMAGPPFVLRLPIAVFVADATVMALGALKEMRQITMEDSAAVLRPCDAIGRYTAALFDPELPMREQMGSLPFNVCLAKNPQYIRANLRRKNEAALQTIATEKQQIERKRAARLSEILSKRMDIETDAVRISFERDSTLRRILNRPPVSQEVRLWHREALVDAKRRDARERVEMRRLDLMQKCSSLQALHGRIQSSKVQCEIEEDVERSTIIVMSSTERQELKNSFCRTFNVLAQKARIKARLKLIPHVVDSLIYPPEISNVL